MTENRSAQYVAQLEAIFVESVANLRSALTAYIQSGTLPDPEARKSGAFAYPEIRIDYHGDPAKSATGRAYGRLATAGRYVQSVTRPALFGDYIREQLDFLIDNYDIEIAIGRSRQEIPFPYVLGGTVELAEVAAADLARYFPSTELAHIGDEIADGVWRAQNGGEPLALFDALRVDFSLARLEHYSGTKPEFFQRYMLFTNYHRYIDAFVHWAAEQVRDPDSRYTALAGPGLYITGDDADADKLIGDSMWRRHQMPAYHLIAENGTGISLVNIGVGPSNAKTITDHLAVLRPEAWART
jgi:AMP nucleosidase